MDADRKIVIIDGYSLIFRAYYAMPPLLSPSGEPTGAVYGFANMLLFIMREHRDARIIVAFDSKEKTFRHELFEEYKGTRKETDEELKSQFGLARSMLDTLGIPVVSLPGFEADDIIGTLAKQCTDAGGAAYVYTGDRDALQLVQYGINVYITLKGVSSTELYDEAKVMEKFGVTSGQIVDYKALCGDASDNIPGAKGIGDKTAVRLLAEYGGVDDILASAAEIKPARIGGIIASSADVIKLSRTLATIVLDVPISIYDIHELQTPDEAAVRAMFQNFGFTSLIKRIGEFTEKFTGTALIGSGSAEKSGSSAVRKPERLVQELDWRALVAPFAGQDYKWDFSAGSDICSASQSEFFSAAKACGCVFFCAVEGGKGGILLAGDVFYYAKNNSELLCLAHILENPDIQKRCFSSKELYLRCFELGINLSGVKSDGVVAAYLANPSRKSYLFEDIALDFGISVQKTEAGTQFSMLEAPPANEAQEFAKKAQIAEQLVNALEYAVELSGMLELYRDMELPLVEVLADIEYTGFAIDTEVLKNIGADISQKISALESQIHSLAGEPFNISSPKQLGVILFEKMGIKSIKKNKTGYSTDKDVLEKLSENHEIARLVIEYRSYAKLKSNYVDSLLDLERSGRLHTSLNQTITATGRLSSTEPNLQNIPVRLEEGRNIRRAFVCDAGCTLLTADYSQIELRVLAHLSGDARFIEAFNRGDDIHAITASEVFGVAPEEVTALMRSHAKEVNFGIIYGMSDFGLSESLKIPVFEARHYIERYFRTYRSVEGYMNKVVENGRKNGFVETMFHRKRQIPELRAHNKNVQAHGVRMARNTGIQGTAADIIKLAMVRLYSALKKNGLKSKIILQVHDELILNVPLDELEEVRVLLRDSMERAAQLSVPLKVQMSTAKTWYDAK